MEAERVLCNVGTEIETWSRWTSGFKLLSETKFHSNAALPTLVSKLISLARSKAFAQPVWSSESPPFVLPQPVPSLKRKSTRRRSGCCLRTFIVRKFLFSPSLKCVSRNPHPHVPLPLQSSDGYGSPAVILCGKRLRNTCEITRTIWQESYKGLISFFSFRSLVRKRNGIRAL
jgi:hypothetical protein